VIIVQSSKESSDNPRARASLSATDRPAPWRPISTFLTVPAVTSASRARRSCVQPRSIRAARTARAKAPALSGCGPALRPRRAVGSFIVAPSERYLVAGVVHPFLVAQFLRQRPVRPEVEQAVTQHAQQEVVRVALTDVGPAQGLVILVGVRQGRDAGVGLLEGGEQLRRLRLHF